MAIIQSWVYFNIKHTRYRILEFEFNGECISTINDADHDKDVNTRPEYIGYGGRK